MGSTGRLRTFRSVTSPLVEEASPFQSNDGLGECEYECGRRGSRFGLRTSSDSCCARNHWYLSLWLADEHLLEEMRMRRGLQVVPCVLTVMIVEVRVLVTVFGAAVQKINYSSRFFSTHIYLLLPLCTSAARK